MRPRFITATIAALRGGREGPGAGARRRSNAWRSIPRATLRGPADRGDSRPGGDTGRVEGQLFEPDRGPRRTRTGVPAREAPLAVRLRPRAVDEVVGQQHLLGEGTALRRALTEGRPHSMILYGPPGTGKTTLARLVAVTAHAAFEELSAVEAGRAEVRQVLERASHRRKATGEPTIFFLDFTSRRLGVRHVRCWSCRAPVCTPCRDRAWTLRSSFRSIQKEMVLSVQPELRVTGEQGLMSGGTRARSCGVGLSECACTGSTHAVSSGRSHD
jgi:hypothetical protein